MDLPAVILNNAPAIVEHASHWVLTQVEGEVGDFAWRQMTRALAKVFPTLAEADPRELKKRLDRLETAVGGMADELRAERERHPNHDIESEMLEPASQAFFADAFSAVMETPDEIKQGLLGRLITQRLYATTESDEELYLRQAESVIRRIGSKHVWALATLYLVYDAPLPSGKERLELENWMDANLLPVLQVVCNDDPTYPDLIYLASLGVVLYDGSDRSSNLSLGEHAPPIEQAVFSVTNQYYPEGKPGRFYQNVAGLYEGKHSQGSGDDRISVKPFTLTPPGFRIASTAVEAILREQKHGDSSLKAIPIP